nr:MAG TPA: hypothetical protein [Caudoviricetes sp.]
MIRHTPSYYLLRVVGGEICFIFIYYYYTILVLERVQ